MRTPHLKTAEATDTPSATATDDAGSMVILGDDGFIASGFLGLTLSAAAGTTWAANSLLIGSGANTVAQVAFAANTFPARASTGNLVAKTITDESLAFLAAGTPGSSTQVIFNDSEVLAGDSGLTFNKTTNALSVLGSVDSPSIGYTLGAIDFFGTIGGVTKAFRINLSGDPVFYTGATTHSFWHAGNDGAGSGLDADTLDGQQGAYYLPAASYTAADVLAKLLTVDGAASGLDADLLDGANGATYLARANHTGTQTLATISDAGTAAAKNTGTSGNTVPLLDGANTWSATQTVGNGSATVQFNLIGAGSGVNAGASHNITNGGATIIAIGNKSNITGGAYNATPMIYGNATIEVNVGLDVAGAVKTAVYTVATLPAGAAGRRAFVTDANATTFASVVAGGGANGVPTYHDGTNWRIG